MGRNRRPSAMSHYSDSELQEALVLCRLDWLRASSWGNDVAAADYRERGRQLVTEHLLRRLDPETGKPLGMTP